LSKEIKQTIKIAMVDTSRKIKVELNELPLKNGDQVLRVGHYRSGNT
jgi:hypothetical protein